MAKNQTTAGITVKKEDDMSEWYNQVVEKAELADFSDVKGCIILRPNGYAIWENIQKYFDERIKGLGVRNAYFPVFIPEHYFKMEAEHAEGFTPEVAWVTHAGETPLEEKLAIRPTSETIMYASYAKWIRSHRELPLRINQWCNVVRWETKATRPFLRSREFLWQEGHCVYETEDECDSEAKAMLNEYKVLCETLLAVPVLAGVKTEKEKFAGAKFTYTVEALMPDGKALQCGTSHNLGQGFAKSFNIRFKGKDNKIHVPWQNSWGFSTRLLGAIIMVHGDDKGLVLPPKLAPLQTVIVPILFDESKKKVLKRAWEVREMLEFSCEVDEREEQTPGAKFNEWEMKGVPFRIEIGPKDLEKDQVVVVRRDTGKKEFVQISELNKFLTKSVEDMQKALYTKAKKFYDDSIVEVNDIDAMASAIKGKKMVKAEWCGSIECEDWIKDKTDGATSRLISFDEKAKGKCVQCSKKSKHLVYWSKTY